MYHGHVEAYPIFPFPKPKFIESNMINKLDPRAEECFYLNPTPNMPGDAMRVIKHNGQAVATRNVSWRALPAPRSSPQPVLPNEEVQELREDEGRPVMEIDSASVQTGSDSTLQMESRPTQHQSQDPRKEQNLHDGDVDPLSPPALGSVRRGDQVEESSLSAEPTRSTWNVTFEWSVVFVRRTISTRTERGSDTLPLASGQRACQSSFHRLHGTAGPDRHQQCKNHGVSSTTQSRWTSAERETSC